MIDKKHYGAELGEFTDDMSGGSSGIPFDNRQTEMTLFCPTCRRFTRFLMRIADLEARCVSCGVIYGRIMMPEIFAETTRKEKARLETLESIAHFFDPPKGGLR